MLNSSLPGIADRAVREFHELIELGLINGEGEFVSTCQYPPMLRLPPAAGEDLFKGYVFPKDGLFAIYAHLPFCIKQCSFCHVPNVISSSESEKDLYLEHIEKEMGICFKRLGAGRLKANSILLGGGSPTFLTPAQLERFLKSFTARVEVAGPAQFSCDIEPLTVIGYEGRERLKILKSFNVTRLSLGAQNFSDDMLRKMNRHHNSADTLRAIGQVKELGFELEIELIYGWPGETEEQWAETVSQALSCGADEITIYRLMLIPNEGRKGAITGMLNKRGGLLKANERVIRLKAIGSAMLRAAGYGETLTRTFSRSPDCFSRYRDDFGGCRRDSLSFGYYALSMLPDRSIQNTPDLKEYYGAIRDNRLPVRTGLIHNRSRQLVRNLVMPLKNRDLSKKQYLDRTGVHAGEVFGKQIALLKKYGLLEETAETLKPTEKGRLFIDDATQIFFQTDYLPFPKAGYKNGPLNPYLDKEAPASFPAASSVVSRK